MRYRIALSELDENGIIVARNMREIETDDTMNDLGQALADVLSNIVPREIGTLAAAIRHIVEYNGTGESQQDIPAINGAYETYDAWHELDSRWANMKNRNNGNAEMN